ncbi:hypothetical protein I3760_12G057000 [Carya illinoinensis]|uniref:Uncharacterized protein n=1 Tax=Carya illinoinensis TaxID=32201 RepID=A0A922DH42_CARIL|nr:hypothetical protein I3760_12G057000 [Carya illinoinensis]KAG6684314.1 hypothetical protein I3842_12G057000 [Carya illinoinensis]
MAASSPAPSHNNTAPAASHNSSHRTDAPPKTLRGLNKPKCQICGNVARSRCPFKSCKSCCSRDQNPCPIHVLKASATVPDKTSSSSTPMFDQQSSEASSSGSSLRVASLRQLSNNFAQFNNVQIPLRSRKPLTKKDAAAINEWRFSKLKEYRDRNVEVEDDAFDRYMHNISLLEEVFSVKSILEESIEDESSVSNPKPTSMEANTETMVSRLKLQLRSNSIRKDNFRRRIKQLVDEGLKKLQKPDLDDDINEPSDQDEQNEGTKKAKISKTEKASTMSDLIDKLNKARNEEDLKSCLEMKLQLFNQDKVSNQTGIKDASLEDQTPIIDSETRKKFHYSLKKLISTTDIDQETLSRIDSHFSSLEQIENL